MALSVFEKILIAGVIILIVITAVVGFGMYASVKYRLNFENPPSNNVQSQITSMYNNLFKR